MSQRPKRKPLEQFYKEEDDELLEGNHMKLYISYLPIHILFVEETFYHESTIDTINRPFTIVYLECASDAINCFSTY